MPGFVPGFKGLRALRQPCVRPFAAPPKILEHACSQPEEGARSATSEAWPDAGRLPFFIPAGCRTGVPSPTAQAEKHHIRRNRRRGPYAQRWLPSDRQPSLPRVALAICHPTSGEPPLPAMGWKMHPRPCKRRSGRGIIHTTHRKTVPRH